MLLCLRGNVSNLEKWLNPLSNSDKHQWLSGMKLVDRVRVQILSGGEGYCVCVNMTAKYRDSDVGRVNVSGLWRAIAVVFLHLHVCVHECICVCLCLGLSRSHHRGRSAVHLLLQLHHLLHVLGLEPVCLHGVISKAAH